MKALITNLAKTATISSLYEVLNYPASNVVDTILDMPFVSSLDTDTLTIDLGSDKDMDAVFIAGCTAQDVTVMIKNNALSTVYNQVKSLPNAVNGIYTGTVTGRYVSITGTAVGSGYFKIKEVGIGVVTDFGEVVSGFGLPVVNETSRSRSATGQVSANRAPSLKQRDISIPVLEKDGGRARVYEILDSLESLGIGNPTFWDITASNQSYEETVYAEIPGAWDTIDNRSSFTVSFSLLEAR